MKNASAIINIKNINHEYSFKKFLQSQSTDTNEIYSMLLILGAVKRNPLFLHEIEWKNNGFLFTTPNIY